MLMTEGLFAGCSGREESFIWRMQPDQGGLYPICPGCGNMFLIVCKTPKFGEGEYSMNIKKRDVKLYNVLFPLWMLLMIPVLWIIVIPGNFIIDSIVLLVSMAVLKIEEKKAFYKRHILKIFAFGMLSDVIGAAYMLLLMLVFRVGNMGDEPYLTVPALLISAVMIFVFDYFLTFKKVDKPLRFKLAMIYAVVTAPYTFLVPSSWLYG